MNRNFDVVVIGSSAGKLLADRLAERGRTRVATADSNPVGGASVYASAGSGGRRGDQCNQCQCSANGPQVACQRSLVLWPLVSVTRFRAAAIR